MNLSAQTILALLQVASAASKAQDPNYNEYDDLTDLELWHVNKKINELMTYKQTADDKACFALYQQNDKDPLVKAKVEQIQQKAKQPTPEFKQWEQYRIMWMGVAQGKSFNELAELLSVTRSYVAENYTKGDLMALVPKNAQGKSFSQM